MKVICPNCKEVIDVKQDDKYGYCKHCSNQFVTSDALNLLVKQYKKINNYAKTQLFTNLNVDEAFSAYKSLLKLRPNDLNAITGVSINGTNAPISNSIVQLYDFTQSNGLAGLVPVPTAEQIADNKDYFLTAKGKWVISNDSRIGNLKYNETTYNTVEEYIEGRMADISLTWESIT